MAWIKYITPDEATGEVSALYDAATKRAGRVFNIVSINSLKPRLMQKFLDFYLAVMFGPSGLSRAQKEMLALVVSRVNHCRY